MVYCIGREGILFYKDGELEHFRIAIEADNISYGAGTIESVVCEDFTMGTEEWKQCICEQNPANCPDDVLYFFHSDHLGSSSFLTDGSGDAYQFLLYLSCG